LGPIKVLISAYDGKDSSGWSHNKVNHAANWIALCMRIFIAPGSVRAHLETEQKPAWMDGFRSVSVRAPSTSHYECPWYQYTPGAVIALMWL
jgi:hypothetical protein